MTFCLLLATRSSPLLLVAQRHAEPPRKILHELPGDAAGARAARGRPFERVMAQRLGVGRNAEMRHVALDHGEELVLAAAVEAEPQAEAVGQRDLLLDGLARIDCGRAL